MKRTGEVTNRILELHDAGLTLSECAKRVGVDRKTIYRWRRHDRDWDKQIRLVKVKRQVLKLSAATERFFAKYGVVI